MRKAVLWLTCMALTLGMIGCGSQNDTGAAAEAPAADAAETVQEAADAAGTADEGGAEITDYSDVEFRIAWWGADIRNTQTVDIIENFEKQYPNLKIDVEYSAFGDYFTKLTTQATAGNLPDVYLMDYSKIVEFAEGGQLEPLDPYIESGAIDLSDVEDSMVAGGIVNDTMYCITTGVNAQVIVYDPAVLEEAGLTLSQAPTWGELSDVIKGVYEKTGQKAHINPHTRSLEIYLRGLGKEMYTEDGTSFAFTAEDLTEYLEHYYDLYESGAAISNADWTEEGLSLKEGSGIWMNYLGDNYSNQLGDKETEAGKPLSLCSEPTADAASQNGMYVKPQMLWGISSTSQNKDLAAAFINYCVNDTYVYDVCATEKGIPISNSMREYVEGSASETEQKISEFIGFLSDGVATDISAPAPTGSAEAETYLSELIAQISYKMLSKDDIPAAAASAIEEGNAVLARVTAE